MILLNLNDYKHNTFKFMMWRYCSIDGIDRLNPRYGRDEAQESCIDRRTPSITCPYLSSIGRCNPYGRRGSYLIDLLRRIQEELQSGGETEGEAEDVFVD